MAVTNPLATPPQQPEIDEFEIMRRRLKQRGAARGEEAQRGLKRQFAALGNLPSGAALRQQQITARETEELTGRELQDVGILQAQTQRAERESAAQRGLERFGIETGAATQRGVAQLQAETQRDIAGQQIEAQLRERQFIEQGLSQRLSSQLSQSREMFDIEQAFQAKNTSFAQEMARSGLDLQQQEFALNKSVTALNSLDPLFSMGFSGDEIGSMFEALNLPFPEEINKVIDTKASRQAAEPPKPPKPELSEQISGGIEQVHSGIVKGAVQAAQSTVKSIFG